MVLLNGFKIYKNISIEDKTEKKTRSVLKIAKVNLRNYGGLITV